MLIDTLIFLPLVTALVLLLIPRRSTAALKGTALAGAAATFALSLVFLTLGPNVAADQSVPWISGTWLASYHVRIDSLRLFFVILTTLVSAACIWAAFSYATVER